MKLWYQEPVVIVAMLVALVPAVLGVLSAFGVAITPGQVAAMASLLTALGAVVARSQVVPLGSGTGGTPTGPGSTKPPLAKEDTALRVALRRFVLALTFVFVAGCTAAEQQRANDILANLCVPVISKVPVVGSAAPIACVILEDFVAEAEAYEVAHGAKPTLTTTAKGETVVPAEMYAGLRRRATARAAKAAAKNGGN